MKRTSILLFVTLLSIGWYSIYGVRSTDVSADLKRKRELGESLRQRIEHWNITHGAYPEKLSDLDEKLNSEGGMRYVLAKEDKKSYYIRYELPDRGSLVCFVGPLYPNTGWHYYDPAGNDSPIK